MDKLSAARHEQQQRHDDKEEQSEYQRGIVVSHYLCLPVENNVDYPIRLLAGSCRRGNAVHQQAGHLVLQCHICGIARRNVLREARVMELETPGHNRNGQGVADVSSDTVPYILEATGMICPSTWALSIDTLLLLYSIQMKIPKARAAGNASAMSELLAVPVDKVNDDRLYRALDRLLPHKEGLEKHLKQKLGELFPMNYDLLLYDVTSTYFEGESSSNDLAQRGYSRDHRPDRKQVNIALAVSRCGMPIGYEVFAGNRHDSQTVNRLSNMWKRYMGGRTVSGLLTAEW